MVTKEELKCPSLDGFHSASLSTSGFMNSIMECGSALSPCGAVEAEASLQHMNAPAFCKRPRFEATEGQESSVDFLSSLKHCVQL